jgi:hypothetical protein
LDVFGEGFNGFPKLPILSPSEIPPPRLSQREKYGGLFYLGIAGLVVLIALVVIFIHGAWALRDVGAAVYILHDPRRPELDRVQAALRLSRDPRVDDAQRMAICLERELPDLARYLLAESISTDLVAADPRSYALAVARSAGWPDWLRLLLARRLTYAAERGYAIPRDALDELAGQADPMIALWATTARGLLAVGPDRSAALALEQASHVPGPQGELAARLLAAVRAPAAHRDPYLDDATTWLRSHYPPSAKVWEGWRESDGRLIRVSP